MNDVRSQIQSDLHFFVITIVRAGGACVSRMYLTRFCSVLRCSDKHSCTVSKRTVESVLRLARCVPVK